MADAIEFTLADEAATERLGGAVYSAIRRAGVRDATVLLRGDLGAGKTCVARGLLRAAGYAGAVPSPTYTLVEPYCVNDLRFYHIDLYRLGDAAELEFLGWRDLRPAILLIEWPERAPEVEHDVDLAIEIHATDAGRRAQLVPLSPTGASLVDDAARAAEAAGDAA